MTRIDMILTMVPTAACKTLVLFESMGEIIANRLNEAGRSLGWVSAVDSEAPRPREINFWRKHDSH